MNENYYEINLMSNKLFLKSYYSKVLPNVNDKISLSENEVFFVEERLLPSTDSNRIVLFGIILK